jgi:hypothetical protein
MTTKKTSTYCPLIHNDCLREDCAWWVDKPYEACALKTIATEIPDKFGGIKYILESISNYIKRK